MTKTCNECKTEKPVDAFYKTPIGDGYETKCKACRIAKQLTNRQTRASRRAEIDKTGNKFCLGCEQEKPKVDFWEQSGSPDGLNPQCKPCVAARQKAWYATLEGQIVFRIGASKARAKAKNLPIDIDKQYLLDLWEKQKGICPITGLPIQPAIVGTPIHRSPFALSIDRIDNSLGYIKGNVRLTTVAGNQARNVWTDADVLEMSLAYLRHNGFTVEKEITNA